LAAIERVNNPPLCDCGVRAYLQRPNIEAPNKFTPFFCCSLKTCKYISYPFYHLSFINVHDSLLVMVVVQFRVVGLGVTSMNTYMDQDRSGQPNLK
jgi:hypothetical protein